MKRASISFACKRGNGQVQFSFFSLASEKHAIKKKGGTFRRETNGINVTSSSVLLFPWYSLKFFSPRVTRQRVHVSPVLFRFIVLFTRACGAHRSTTISRNDRV